MSEDEGSDKGTHEDDTEEEAYADEVATRRGEETTAWPELCGHL